MVNPPLTAYLNDLFPVISPNHEAWRQLSVDTNYPIMSADSVSFLQWFMNGQKPRNLLELGCGYGYVSFHLMMVHPELKVTGIDYNPANWHRFTTLAGTAISTGNFDMRIGNAVELVQTITQTFDWIIVDVDKRFYPILFDSVIRLLNPGGFLIADNVLWKGRLWQPADAKNVEPIRLWNQLVAMAPGLETRIIPVGDGLSVSRKI